MFYTIIAKIYARIYAFCHYRLKFNLKGFGILLDKIKHDQIIIFSNNKLYFHSDVARAYGLLIVGISNEKETHLFLDRVLSEINFSVEFIDVGTSIGEFVIAMASKKNVSHVFGFEPNFEAFRALKYSILINELSNVSVINKAVSEDGKELTFFYNKKSPTGSQIFPRKKHFTEKRTVLSTTLDSEFTKSQEPTIMLIDVEGAELMVMKGGVNLIRNNYPLIIFEYNEVSKKHFSLEDVLTLLGKDYDIYRLKSNGWLDKNYNNTWNMVAVHSKSLFFPVIKSLIK